MIKEQIKKDLKKAIEKSLGIKVKDIHLEHPTDSAHGDYASNVALTLAKKLNKPPMEIANVITQFLVRTKKVGFSEASFIVRQRERELKFANVIDRVEVVKPGFINFFLSQDFLVDQLYQVLKRGDKFGSSSIGKGKRVLLEHTSPDPFKPLHIGHLRNNFLGMAVGRLLKFSGYKLILDCIINDRGTHVCKVMWGYLAFGEKSKIKNVMPPVGQEKVKIKDRECLKIPDATVKKLAETFSCQEALDRWIRVPEDWFMPEDLRLKTDKFDLLFYALANRAEKQVDGVFEQVRQFLRAWEAEDRDVRALWRQIIDWGLAGQTITYRKVGSRHDHVWYESKLYQKGKELVYQGLKKGIFRESEGAVVSNLAKYNLPDTVVIKSDGTSLYHTFDLNLTLQKRKNFPSDFYIWDIGSDQILYLKQLFAMCEQLGIGKKEDYFHLNYGYVFLKDGKKMKSREGNVIEADELIEKVSQMARRTLEKSEIGVDYSIEEKNKIIEEVSLGALKYGLLKYARDSEVYFDLEESISLEGNSAPYLQYTYARAASVLRKAGGEKTTGQSSDRAIKQRFFSSSVSHLSKEERSILRMIYKFPEIVQESATNYAPSVICTYLFELAQKFNAFYENIPVIKAETEEGKEFRLNLTNAVAQVVKSGLRLLNIGVLEEM